MIQLENVSKVYRAANGPVHALADITLQVDQGQFVVVRGPSGCGKSTLLTVVGGLGAVTSGNVLVDGLDVVGMSPAARARFRAVHIGFVFQTFHLLPYLTVVENVAAAAAGESFRQARPRAVELLERFQLAHRLKHRPSELSIGECQRVAIARSMINAPRLILADEPTGNLDPENSAGVLDLLSGFHRDGGTVLMVTHQKVPHGYSDRTILLRDGRLDSNGHS